MIAESLILATATGASGLAIYARGRRASLYRRLAEQLDRIAMTSAIDVGPRLRHAAPGFDARITSLRDVLARPAFDEVRGQALALVAPERSYVPTHKKGGTIAYETLFEAAPAIVALYHSGDLREFVGRVAGVEVQPTPINDQSSLSVLHYDRPGDHIGWHYDHNFYRGRHFTVLLPIVNEGSAPQGLSHATLRAMIAGAETEIATPPNALVLFEGALVRHKVTPISAGERRLVISMTYCTDPRTNALKGIARRIKDTAFFGPRALWT